MSEETTWKQLSAYGVPGCCQCSPPPETHRAEYESDPKGFRQAVMKAHARIFRLKPGPQGDPRIAVAARERAQGSTWEPLYTKYIDHYVGMPEFTRDLAESGLRKKVNTYLHKHPLLKRKWRQKTTAPEPQ